MLIREAGDVQILREFIEIIRESENNVQTKIQHIPEIFGGGTILTASNLDNNGDVESYSYQFNNPNIADEPLVVVNVGSDRLVKGYFYLIGMKIMEM